MAAYPAVLRDAVSVLLDAGFSRIIQPSDTDRRVAAMIVFLSGREDLALHWVRLKQAQSHRWKAGIAVDVTRRALRDWCIELRHDSLVSRSLREPASCFRSEVHLFLAESVVRDRLLDLSDVGILVPSRPILDMYVRLLNCLPQSRVVVEMRDRLREKPSYTKKWLRRFRETWGFCWGATHVPHGIGEAVQDRRMGIFFRWMAYELAGVPHDGHVLVINMDETMLSAVKTRKVGNAVNTMAAPVASTTVVRKSARLPRTSYIASVCSCAALQKILPQVRLVRGSLEKPPSRPVLDAYAAAGFPQIARHGGTGWASADILVWWLRTLVSAVRLARPGIQIILVLDDAPSHIAEVFLKACARYSVRVVVVPAKMTWCLQPLDTHVFSKLKHRIREYEFALQAATSTARIPPLERVRLHGQAIKNVVVDEDWSVTLSRSGLTAGMAAARPALASRARSMTLTPTMPTVAELVEILQVNADRAAAIRALLTSISRSPSAPAVQAAAASSGAAAASSVREAPPRNRSQQPIILSTRARLPRGHQPQRPATNVWWPDTAVQRPVTRSQSRAAGLEAAALPTTPAGPPMRKRSRKA